MSEFISKIEKPMHRVEYRVHGILKRRDYVNKKDALFRLACWIIEDCFDFGDYDISLREYYEDSVLQMLEKKTPMPKIVQFIEEFDLQGAIDKQNSKNEETVYFDMPF